MAMTMRKRTNQKFAARNRTSTSIPTEMKKKLVKISRNGRTILAAWWLYSDPDMISPASRAPIARDIPVKETIHATPKQVRMTTRRKSSWLRVRAISCMTRGMTHFASAMRMSTMRRS